jgi:hypothetical protein
MRIAHRALGFQHSAVSYRLATGNFEATSPLDMLGRQPENLQPSNLQPVHALRHAVCAVRAAQSAIASGLQRSAMHWPS